MKLFLATFLCAQACAFTVVSPPRHATLLNAAEYTPMEGEGRINLKASARNMLTVDLNIDANFFISIQSNPNFFLILRRWT